MSRRVIWGIAATVVVVAVSLVAASGAFLAEGALHPQRGTPYSDVDHLVDTIASEQGARVRTVFLVAADGTRLHAYWLSQERGTGRAVLIAHGVGDSAWGSAGYARMFLQQGYGVLLPESRGHGQSEGLATYGLREGTDIKLWLEWMRREGGATRLYGLGESLGASILLDSLEEGAQFNAVVAECAYSSFPDIARERAGSTLAGVGLLYVKLRYGIDL